MPTIKERDRSVVWHPYTPMKIWPESVAIVGGNGVFLEDENGKRYIDAISSWWVNLHGHSNPYIARKVGQQLTTLEHCIFAGFTHEPAVALAERLLEIVPGQLAKIFYSDNGSTAVEVAIKMALQYWSNKKETSKNRIVALESAYHGDTFGAMSISDRSSFTKAFDSLLFATDRIPFPETTSAEKCVDALRALLQTGQIAALIVEPLVQGASGMKMYSPEVLRALYSLCKQHDTLVIADEVMTGFGRTGKLFASDGLGSPDIVCLSKGLTGGTMALGVTACSQEVFDAFYSDDRSTTLYHGHSYTANPLACVAGLASLDLLLSSDCSRQRELIRDKHQMFVNEVSGYERVSNARYTGTILALEIDNEGRDYNHHRRDEIYRHFLDRGILLRPLGNTIYIMPPYCISESQLDSVYAAIREIIQ